MITTDNIKELLIKLGFSEEGGIFSKYIHAVDAYMRVDFNKQELIYPEDKGLKINERQMCNFSAKENFVVFECVHRLLEKGYKPYHIELKPLWHAGYCANGASRGRAYILIRDNDNKALLIIECKTWGDEFNNAWKDILSGKGQLFHYAHQERSTQYICLYTSGLENGELKYISNIIVIRDNEEILKRKSTEKPQAYRDAESTKELYEVWKHTYECNYAKHGIFEPNVQPYQIGKPKYTVADLRTVTEADIQYKYNEFTAILRQYNVSGRENAFDKLVNLFLCKIVDEKHNPNDLQFYWRGIAFDSYFDLIDRLQRLYRDGMEKFFKENITYIEDKTICDMLKSLEKDPNATSNNILEYFRRQKYFSNNYFAFIEVQNEKLFYHNAEILAKIVSMLQDIRLNSDNQNQFLGDMFEFFLDQSFKKTEGQFFTPLPVTRFIILSLPLETVFNDDHNPPKAIDYACGTGHFLTELAFQLHNIRQGQDVSFFYSHFYGIEKEYRLAKVAKVSVCMYNQDEINIIHADALMRHPCIQDGTFKLLVSNPPYSVKGFLEILPEAERTRYTLIKTIDPKSYSTNNAIEAFFLERAKQLLAPHGVAGIILPSSILSNVSGVYTRVREILLQNFDIIALVELGSGTFGKTGTNTVTLFLRRKDDNLAHAEYYRNLINTWFDGDTDRDGVFADAHLLQAYCDHIGIPINDYRTLLQSIPNQTLLETEKFKEYRRAFDTSSEVKAIQKQESFYQKSAAEQQTELDRRFIQFVREIEREKLYYFILAYTQPCPVIVVRSPQGTEEMKKFLGYEWSAAKGKEGIKYLRGSIENIETPLFDTKDRNNPEKISTIIRRNFEGQTVSIPESLKPYVTIAHLVDLLDFSRVSFDKQILLNPKFFSYTTITIAPTSVFTKYPIKRLGEIAELFRGASPRPIESYLTDADDGIPWIKIGDARPDDKFITQTAQKITASGAEKSRRVSKGDFVISNSMSVGRPYILQIDGCVHDGWLVLTNIDPSVNKEYLYYVLLSDYAQSQFQERALGGVVKNLNIERARNVQIPIPPLDVQAQIVTECQAIDAEVEEKEKKIIIIKNKIEEVLKSIKGSYKKIKDVAIINPPKREIQDKDDSTIVSFVGMESVSNEGFITKMEDKCLGEIRKGSYTYFRENDIIIAKIAGSMEDGKCALAQGLRNGIGMGSSEFHVLRAKQELIDPKFLFLMINREDIRKKAQKHFIGSSRKRVPTSFYEDYEIIVPSLEKQKEVIDRVKKLEDELNEARDVISSAQKRRRSVLRKYF